MRHELDFWVVGGDQRQACLAGLLAADGHTVHTYALEQAGDLTGEAIPSGSLTGLDLADCIVLPLPLLGEGERVNAPLAEGPVTLGEVLAAARPGQILCAGRVEEKARAAILRRELVLRDYFAREELAVANAVPTAEAMGQRFGYRNRAYLQEKQGNLTEKGENTLYEGEEPQYNRTQLRGGVSRCGGGIVSCPFW